VADPLPTSTSTLVIGAGVHGLSTAWHLARQGREVLVVDKSDVASGASGIACGIVRNNYFQPAMQELMAACVEVWESEPEALHYHPSGYIALGPAAQEEDLSAVFERQQRIGLIGDVQRRVRRHIDGPASSHLRNPGEERLASLSGGEQRDQILVRMTHRHFAIFRTRVKPYRAYNSSGPVCK